MNTTRTSNYTLKIRDIYGMEYCFRFGILPFDYVVEKATQFLRLPAVESVMIDFEQTNELF